MRPWKVDYSSAECVCVCAYVVCTSLFDRVAKGCSSSYYALAAAGARITGGQSDNSRAHKRPNALWVSAALTPLAPKPPFLTPTLSFSSLDGGFFILWLSALYLMSQLGEATKILCLSYSTNQQINHSRGQSISAAHARSQVLGYWRCTSFWHCRGGVGRNVWRRKYWIFKNPQCKM